MYSVAMPNNLSTPHNNSPVTSVSTEMLITLMEFKWHNTCDWHTVTRLFNIPINLLQVTMWKGESFFCHWFMSELTLTFQNSVVLKVAFTFKVIGLILLMSLTVHTLNTYDVFSLTDTAIRKHITKSNADMHSHFPKNSS